MNATRTISTVLLFSSLALSALPAQAVSFHSTRSVTRSDDGGTSFRNLASSATHFCFLSRVGVENTDEDGESAICQVKRGGRFWRLEATLGEDNDADVFCSAICYNN